MCISYKIRFGFVHSLFIAAALLFAALAHSAVPATTPVAAEKSPVAGIKSAGTEVAGNSPVPIVLDTRLPLGFAHDSKASLQNLPFTWLLPTPVNFVPANAILKPATPLNQASDEIRTGQLSWHIGPSGTRVVDSSTGMAANIAALTSADVRAREVVFNERLGIVWFYGQSIYRYRMQTHELARMQQATADLQAIRKIVAGHGGLWLADRSGIFLLDESGVTLSKVVHGGVAGENIINAAVADQTVWFVTSAAKLVRLRHIERNQVEIAVSTAISAGMPAEIFSMKQTLWMLLSNKQGEYYKLAYLDKGSATLDVITGKYFSLSADNGQLMASAYATSFKIDPEQHTMTRLGLSIPGTLERATKLDSVLFIGASYAYKDNCEIVEHGVIDISRGWVQALLKSTLLFK